MSLPPATLKARSYFGIPSSILRIQLSVLCATIGMGMVYSVLTLNAKSLGANAWDVGLLLAAFGGVRCLANLPTGVASEYFGRRWTAVGGLVVAAVASFAAAAAYDFATLLASVLVLGFALGIYNTASLGAIVDLGTHETRVRDMAAYQGTFLLGLSLGPALGGIAAAQWGFGGVYALQGMLAFVAMLVLCRAADVAPRQRVKLDLRIMPAIAGPAAMIYGITFARCVTIWVLLPLVASVRFGMDLDMIGVILTAGCAATLAVLPIVAPLTRLCGRLPVMLGASVLLIAGLESVSVSRHREVGVVEFFRGVRLGDLHFHELLAVLVDDDMRGGFHSLDILVTGEEFFLNDFLLTHRIVGARLHLDKVMCLLVEEEADVALAFLGDANADGGSIHDGDLADR